MLEAYSRPLRFLAVGLINTAIGYGLFALLVLAGIPSAIALLLATIGGVVWNFFTTGRLVFASRKASLFPRFVAAYMVTYGFNLVLLKALERAGIATLISQAICLPLVVGLSYMLLRYLVFVKRRAE